MTSAVRQPNEPPHEEAALDRSPDEIVCEPFSRRGRLGELAESLWALTIATYVVSLVTLSANAPTRTACLLVVADPLGLV